MCKLSLFMHVLKCVFYKVLPIKDIGFFKIKCLVNVLVEFNHFIFYAGFISHEIVNTEKIYHNKYVLKAVSSWNLINEQFVFYSGTQSSNINHLSVNNIKTYSLKSLKNL